MAARLLAWSPLWQSPRSPRSSPPPPRASLSGAWIKSQKVVIEKGKITEYRELLKVTFVLLE